MRCMERNKTLFYYSLYIGKESIRDKEGYESGESRVIYSKPVSLRANISPAAGSSSIEQFGNSIQYDKVIVLDDLSCPIDENSVLFIDTVPTFDEEGYSLCAENGIPLLDERGDVLLEENGAPLFNYIVKKVARSLNSISIAISKVEVS